MKIILGSNNKSKKEAIELALKKLNIEDAEITLLEVDSHVSSKPLDEETLEGAHNRNQEVLKYCKENNIDYDMIISIEGGYEQVGDYFFIVTYACITDKQEKEYFGKSQGLKITKRMFEWVKSGNSLNKVIEEILSTSNNKKGNGISGYLTSGHYYRSYFDSTAVESALIQKENIDNNYKQLEKSLESKN